MSELNAGNSDTRIAMLIDGDNAQATILSEMIAEASKYGLVTIRRIYGDWTSTSMGSWKEPLSIHAIQPFQQFRNTIGKNATDSAMIIDAMDILYEKVVNGFCLVSSDSDYTRLAMRIREKGLFVMGIGRRTTPKAFVNACEVFVFTENLVPEAETAPTTQRSKPKGTAEPGQPDLLPLLKNAVDLSLQDDGWAFLGVVGNRLRQLDPSFDPRTYGYRQLSQLVRSLSGEFETREENIPGGTTAVYIRYRDRRPK